LYFLVDSVLERPAPMIPEMGGLLQLVPALG
jgi:hypothetical protein